MKKNDWILFGSIILLSLILGGGIFLYKGNDQGNTVQITVAGQVYKTVPLNENQEILIESEDGGKNLLIIEDGKIYIKEANCPNHQCIKQGKTAQIVCLPNKVIVEIINIEGESFDETIDGISR